MRLTVIGSGPAWPQPDTPASGLLVETADSAILLDCGPGVISRLSRTHDPRRLTAIVVGHLHADHYLDLAPLRYLFPWAGGGSGGPRILLPPGGLEHITALAAAISERATFFAESLAIEEYAAGTTYRLGDADLTLVPGSHYVPAWGVAIRDTAGSRLVYAGDTGPNDALVEAAAGADLLIVEATLADVREDEPRRRGHLTADEALDHAARAGVSAVVLTHYPSARREQLEAAAAQSRIPATVGRPGVVADVVGGAAVDVRCPDAESLPIDGPMRVPWPGPTAAPSAASG